jgi:hypothetical protein
VKRLIGTRAPTIKRSLEPLHKDMLSVNQILRECKRRPSVHVVDKVRYLVLYKAKLEAFRDKLPAHRMSISVMQELIEDQTLSERRASTVKLCGLIESQELQQKREEEYDEAQKEVVRIFEERHSSIEDGRQLSTSEMLEQLEDDLVAKGIPREQAGQQLFPITKALLLHPLPASLNRGLLSPTTEIPAFKLDVFESKMHGASLASLHGSESRDNSELD